MKKSCVKNINAIAVLCLLLVLSGIFCFFSKAITDHFTDAAFQDLQKTTAHFAEMLRIDTEQDTELLKLAADSASTADALDDPQVLALMDTFPASTLFCRMQILLPSGEFLLSDGSRMNSSLSFEDEAAAGVHATKQVFDPLVSDGRAVYIMAPIVRDGTTVAMFCGVIDLDLQKDLYSSLTGSTPLRFHLFSTASRELLIDTTHSEDIGPLPDTSAGKLSPDYDLQSLLDDFTSGRPGDTAFFSSTINEYMYCSYAPVGVNGWMIIVGEPESAVFQSVIGIRHLLYLLAALEALAFLCYILWLLFHAKHEQKRRQLELDRVRYINSVEETLFNSAHQPELICSALQKVAEMADAERAFFVGWETSEEKRLFSWPQMVVADRQRLSHLHYPVLEELIAKSSTQSLVSYDLEALLGASAPEELSILRTYEINSVMAVMVHNAAGEQTGYLMLANLHDPNADISLLECVARCFSMAATGLASFQAIEELGIIDQLTGLRNRNCYQSALSLYESSSDASLACIYVDADGLHDMNNNYGHAAGDELLKCVADALVSAFGPENSFRIGGDEFVAFCSGLTEKEIHHKIRVMEHAVSKHFYHISTGMERRANALRVSDMVSRAEEKMYESKRAYHARGEDEQQRNALNRHLEATLLEKRDLEVFRSILAYKYAGVYILNLSLDTIRSIYIPSHFIKALDVSRGKFSQAFRYYTEHNVLPEYRSSLLQYLDYQSLESCFSRQEELKIHYIRSDGQALVLHIHPSPEYSAMNRECIWIFEIPE